MLQALLDRITAENFASIITSVFAGLGLLATAVAGKVLYKTRQEPPPPRTAEDMVVAYNQSLVNNNAFLSSIAPAVGSMAQDIRELKRISEKSLDVQGDIHLEMVRGSK